MIMSKGRISSMPILFNKYKDEAITIVLFKERITIFPDGTMKRSKTENFSTKK